jgi:hypothetical protein
VSLHDTAMEAAITAVEGERVWRDRGAGREWGTVMSACLKLEDGDNGFLFDVLWDTGQVETGLDEDDQLGDLRPHYGPPDPRARHDISDLLLGSFLLESTLVGKLTAKSWSPRSLAWVEDRLGHGGDPARGEGPGGS